MMSGKARLHLAALLAVTALLFLWPGQQADAQKGGGSNFWPGVDVQLDGYWLNNEEHIYINSNLYANDVMYQHWVQFTPADWFVAAGADVPDGAQVGDTWDGVAVGSLNGPCNNWVSINYQWQDATTDTANSFTYNPATSPISSTSWPGYGIMASGLERAVERYPNFLNDMGFPAPRARYYSHVSYAGTEMAAQYLIFQPGTSLPGLPSFDSGLGYPSLILIQDPTAPPTPASATTDICTNWQRNDNFWPWSGDNPDTAANEDGYPLRRNPPGWGNYDFVTFARGRADADGDGIENDLDTCPLDPNWDENPRDGNGPDGDGLDSACDSEWDVYNEDQDDDGYLNRGDNCPLVANGLSGNNQLDTDRDGIGNACDTHPNNVDGSQEERWSDFWVEVTGDSDNDTWSDAFERIAGSDPNWEISTPEGLWRTPWTCSDGVDNDLDGLMDGYDLGCDRDNDRVANMFDSCVEDPEDWDGFQDSDGCPDSDNDMDGICDPWYGQSSCGGSDNCPNVPEDYDAFQDWDGCPDADNDADGFPDVTDECPGTDWTVGPDGIADSGDEPKGGNGVPIQTREDYDGIIDGDGCHDSPGDDYDADGFADEVEHYMGTDPTDACPDVVGSDDAWPLDINMDGYITVVGDALNFRGRIGACSGPPPHPKWLQRLDLNADYCITVVGDALLYRGMIGKTCT
jgi:hypothetical protein